MSSFIYISSLLLKGHRKLINNGLFIIDIILYNKKIKKNKKYFGYELH